MFMADYNIRDLEKLSGIMAHTIRIWEKRYKIFNPDRTDTNRRRYSDDDLRRIINIAILNRNGFKISKIAQLSSREIDEKVAYLAKDIKQTDTQIDSLIIAMTELDERRFTDVLNRSIISKGFEETYDDTVFPFLRKVGVLWSTGSVLPAQEHFISNLVRQKLIAAIDSLSIEKNDDSKKILFFLPENELHELGLLYYKYLADKLGHQSLYLGQLTPLGSVEYTINTWLPHIIVTGTLSAFSNIDNSDFIAKLTRIAGNTTVVLAGDLGSGEINGGGRRIVAVKNSSDFLKIISEKSKV